MRTLGWSSVSVILAGVLFAATAFAGKPRNRASGTKAEISEPAVFITGSLIPQRVRLKSIGTATVSPVRIIDRREIDGTGRRTTRGALITDPSVR